MNDPSNQSGAQPPRGSGAAGAPPRSPASFSDEINLGQYRVYAQTVENAADRRAASNRFYVTIHISVIAALAIVGGYGLFVVGGGSTAQPNALLTQIQPAVVAVAGVVGIALCFVWRSTIRSAGTLQSAKFEVIHSMETWLPFRAFKDEAAKLDEKKYTASTKLESRLPWLTLFMYLALLGLYIAATNHWLPHLTLHFG